MTWEKTHTKTKCTPPWMANIFASAGAIWKCDECGSRFEVTKTRTTSGSVTSGWRRLS